jgi:hypothetical protein
MTHTGDAHRTRILNLAKNHLEQAAFYQNQNGKSVARQARFAKFRKMFTVGYK